jgi:hypothetical protein
VLDAIGDGERVYLATADPSAADRVRGGDHSATVVRLTPHSR